MSSVRSAAVGPGIAGGVLFVAHAVINGSRAYPLVWPAIAGAIAFSLATRTVSLHPVRHGLLASLAAGTLAAIIGFVGASITAMTIGRGELAAPTARPGVALAAAIGIGAACLVAIVAAVVGGLAMALVWRLRGAAVGRSMA